MGAGGQTVFEIVLQRRTDDGWPVLMKHTRPGELFAARCEGTLRLAPEALLACADPRVYGEMLGRALFQQERWAAFAGALAQARQGDDLLRVLLTIEDADLRALHWERLCAPFDGVWDFLSLRQATPFSINLDSLSARSFAPIGRQDLSALLLVAGPADLRGEYDVEHFDIPETVRLVRAALGQIPVDVLASGGEGALGRPDLDTLCARLTAGRYTLLHIVCHGQVAGGETRLMMPGADGRPITGSALVERLGKIQELPYFTFLMSCESADPRAENGFGGLGQRLVRELGLPAVLAMTASISVQTAGALASEFYPFLYQHGQPDRALNEALAGAGSRPDTVPAVFSRLAGRSLFSDALDRVLTPAEIEHGLVEEVCEAAGQWAARPRADRLVHRGERLEKALALQWLKRYPFSQTEIDYLAACRRQREQDRRRQRGLTVVAIVAVAAMTLLSIFARNSSIQAGQNLRTAAAGAITLTHALAQSEMNLAAAEERGTQAAGLAATADWERGRAEEYAATASAEANISLARQLAAQSKELWNSGSQFARALLLGIESLSRYLEVSTHQTVSEGLMMVGVPVAHMQHGREIASLAFSPDGTLVASGGWDGTARVWEAATGHEIARMQHEDGVISLAFSPDGKLVVSGSCDQTEFGSCTMGSARVWEATTGREIARVRHDSWVESVTFSPDGTWVVSGSRDGSLRVWETETGREVTRMQHGDHVSSVVFSPDGTLVASGGWDGRARVWLARTGGEIARMEHESGVSSLVFSPDGRWVVSGSWDGSARVWVARTGREIARMTHGDDITSVAFSPDGTRVASGSWDGSARVWVAETGREIARMQHGDNIRSVAFSQDGTRVVSGGCDQLNESYQCTMGSARVWEAATGNEIVRGQHEGWVVSVAISPDGTWVVSGSADGSARVWAAGMGMAVARMQHEYGVYSVAVSPDGQWVVSGGGDGSARVWATETGREITRVQQEYGVSALAISPDGGWVISGSRDGSAQVWEASTGREVVRVQHKDWVSAVAFSPDGKWVASGGCEQINEFFQCIMGSARVVGVGTGMEIVRVQHKGEVNSLAFSPDGSRVASGGWDGSARVWEARTGLEIVRVQHEGEVNSVAFSPDGRWVISGSEDGSVRVWEAATGVEIIRVQQEGGVTSLAFSPDGRWVVSGGYDGSVRLWDVVAGGEIARMQHEDGVTSVAFSPDGRWVVSGSLDGSARVWMWRPEDLIAEACRRLSRNLTQAEWRQYLGENIPYERTCPDLPAGE